MISSINMVLELVGAMLFKPFFLFKLSFMACVRGSSIIINTWVEFLSAFIHFNVSVFWRFVVWTLCLITLPTRAVAALHREKQLQARLYELQDRLDSLSWDRKELQEHIRFAVNEHAMVEMMLGELEEEHEVAIHKIKLLETELQDLKDENHRLKEVNGKSQWDTNILMHKDIFKDVNKGKLDANDSVKNINENKYLDNTFGQKREFAVSQSVFSSMLSLLVGMVIWEAQEPCMPLVTALYMVVGMSLKSVVQFFSTIKNKPASDAVALLSLNWFILGALTYPTLPKVAHLSAPLLTKSLGWIWCQLRYLIGINKAS